MKGYREMKGEEVEGCVCVCVHFPLIIELHVKSGLGG